MSNLYNDQVTVKRVTGGYLITYQLFKNPDNQESRAVYKTLEAVAESWDNLKARMDEAFSFCELIIV